MPPAVGTSALARRRWWARPETAIFCGLLAVYGAATNTRGLYHFDLQMAVVEALVEHGRLSIRDDTPGEPLGVDRFLYEGRVYARRNPERSCSARRCISPCGEAASRSAPTTTWPPRW